jgi:class 3 adenylate cyclase
MLGRYGVIAPPLPWNPAEQVAVLIPLGCALAWVSLSVPSVAWRAFIQAAAIFQIAGAAGLSRLLDQPVGCGVPLIALAIIWGTGEALHLWSPFPTLPVPNLEEARSEREPVETPKREECTVLHCELLNHPQLVGALPPEEATDFINRFLAICSETAASRYGTADRTDSEAYRAVFVPHPEGEPHSKAALHAALAIHTRMKTLSTDCEVRFGQDLDVRIGISSGEVLVGRFGLPGATRHGVAGETAEWARRLAGANLLYGSNILISEQTALLAGRSVETRPIDRLQRQLPPNEPEEVFELLALAGTLDAEAVTRLTHYRRGVAHLRNRNWKAARNALRAARPIGRSDSAIDMLLHRIEEQEALAAMSQGKSQSSPAE